jgi:hypothetical protein
MECVKCVEFAAQDNVTLPCILVVLYINVLEEYAGSYHESLSHNLDRYIC